MFKLRYLMLAFCATVCSLTTGVAQSRHTFSMADSTFLLDGKPFQIISGELHYPRVPREAWRDRMKAAKAMGLNTIGTYVFWNLHEPQKGVFDFSGNNDIAEFVRIAQQEGLWVVLRPSPYVCAEWEFGGYPYWLQNEKGLKVRSKEKQYLKEYEAYIREVGKRLAPLQINHGGNVLMVQIENEYGSYGKDKEYLAINQHMFKEAGFDGLLYTCDPAADAENGYLEGLMPGINGLDNPQAVKSIVKRLHKGKGPYFIAEWYPAWFDWWGAPHHTLPAETYAQKLDSVLAAGISINMYMFHGGTTRGFMNGANYKDISPYEPQTSSYDYDAPLNEAGNPTNKFLAFRNVIAKHLPKDVQLPPIPRIKPSVRYEPVFLKQTAILLNNLPNAVVSDKPKTFEDLHQDYGYVLYRTVVSGGKKIRLKVNEIRDFAIVMINGKKVGTLDRRTLRDSIDLQLPAGKANLDILVENMGRINFGKYLLANKKGITEKVTLDGKEVKGWKIYSYPMSKISGFHFSGTNTKIQSPVLKKGVVQVQQQNDTYLDMTGWGKGVAWVNGHNLGKFWNIGPQQTLYIPKEWLKKGTNEVIVLDLLNYDLKNIKTIDKPILDVLNTK